MVGTVAVLAADGRLKERETEERESPDDGSFQVVLEIQGLGFRV